MQIFIMTLNSLFLALLLFTYSLLMFIALFTAFPYISLGKPMQNFCWFCCEFFNLSFVQNILNGFVWRSIFFNFYGPRAMKKQPTNQLSGFFVTENTSGTAFTNNSFYFLEVWLWYHRISRLIQTLMFLINKGDELE